MEFTKIRAKYCTDEKVQIMLSNANRQIIFSQDGFLYLRDNSVLTHKYLDDPIRTQMPFKDHPSSDNHATHLFKYNQIYVKHTSNRDMRYPDTFSGFFTLSFLYLIGLKNGNAVFAEAELEHFKSVSKKTKIMDTNEIKNFLFDISNCNTKCVLDSLHGIKFAKSSNETVLVDNYSHTFEEQNIVKAYNGYMRPNYLFTYHTEEAAKNLAKTIEDVKPFNMLYQNRNYLLATTASIYVVEIIDTHVVVYKVDISFISPDKFEVNIEKFNIHSSCFIESLPSDLKRLAFSDEPVFNE